MKNQNLKIEIRSQLPPCFNPTRTPYFKLSNQKMNRPNDTHSTSYRIIEKRWEHNIAYHDGYMYAFITDWTWQLARVHPFSVFHFISSQNLPRKKYVCEEELTLMAYEFDEPLAALMSSSARHSAMDLTLRNADSRVYSFCQKSQ